MTALDETAAVDVYAAKEWGSRLAASIVTIDTRRAGGGYAV
jgi:hypothetical protein